MTSLGREKSKYLCVFSIHHKNFNTPHDNFLIFFSNLGGEDCSLNNWDEEHLKMTLNRHQWQQSVTQGRQETQ